MSAHESKDKTPWKKLHSDVIDIMNERVAALDYPDDASVQCIRVIVNVLSDAMVSTILHYDDSQCDQVLTLLKEEIEDQIRGKLKTVKEFASAKETVN